jgi:serine/threonine-protein kinase
MQGALLGTPAYLAPEAITNPSRADARSDLYSLAAVGYWLLVGDLVFPAQTVVEVCVHHLHTPPVPPAERCAGPIPAELNDLILRCLAKDPALRPASALELSRLLGAIGAAGSWSREQADTWWTTRAPDLLASARTHGGAGSTPGPRTIAVDMEHRTPSSRVRARR